MINKGDEISFVMLINRLRAATEFKDLNFPEGYLDGIGKAPGDVLDVIGRIMSVYLREINLPEEGIRDAIDQIKGGNMNRLFEHFEGFDIQAARREARAEGKDEFLIEQVCKKLKKSKSIAEIAADLEEDEPRIQAIVNIAEKYAPNYNADEILKELLQ